MISCSSHLWKILQNIKWYQKQWHCFPPAHTQCGKRGRFWLGWDDGKRLWPLLHQSTAVLPDFRFWSQAAPQGCQQGAFCLHLLNLHYFLVTTVIKPWSLSSWYNYKWHDTCYGMSSICRGKERAFLGWPDRLKPVRHFFFLCNINKTELMGLKSYLFLMCPNWMTCFNG